MKNKSKKAQFFSADVVFAVVVFIGLVITIGSYWDYSTEKIMNFELRGDIEFISRNAFNVLLATEGIPPDWETLDAGSFNESRVKSVGLSKNMGSLSLEKIEKLKQLNESKYTAIKTLLGVIGPNYEFQLDIYQWNGTGYQLNLTLGAKVEPNATRIVSLHRYAMINSTLIYANFKGWERCAESC